MKYLSIITSILGQLGNWNMGKPISISVPAETVTVDLGTTLGKATITESGTTLTITKA
jgi:hypothetical protein